jgi:hypothetical protein
MMACLILVSVAFMGGAFAGGLFVVIIGIHRGDHGKRLTSRPGSNSEAFARRLLTGSRGYDSFGDAGEGQ